MLFLAALAQAEPTWTVTVDPLTFALGFAHVQVEHAFHPRCSLYAGPSLRLYDSLLGEPSGDYRGYGAEAGLRWFFTPSSPEGGWLMARGVLAAVVAEDTSLGGYTSALGGYTWVADFGLVLSGGLGVSWFDYGEIHGVLPAAHTNVGWAL